MKINGGSRIVTKGVMINSCHEIIEGVFNLNNVKYFNDSFSIYSDISFR